MNNNIVLFYMLFLHIGAHGPPQSKEQSTVKTNLRNHAHTPKPTQTHAHTHTHTHTHSHTLTLSHTVIHEYIIHVWKGYELYVDALTNCCHFLFHCVYYNCSREPGNRQSHTQVKNKINSCVLTSSPLALIKHSSFSFMV